jgi:hypothetical protein
MKLYLSNMELFILIKVWKIPIELLDAGKMKAWNLDCLKMEFLFIIKGTHLCNIILV